MYQKPFTIVAITGSAGKTSAVEACKVALQTRYKVRTNDNQNAEYSLPANILGFVVKDFSPIGWLKILLLAPIKLATNFNRPDIYLVEMDVDGPSPPLNISYLLTIIQPDIAIHLNVSTVHTQNFDHLIPASTNSTNRIKIAKKLMCQQQQVLVQSLKPHQTAILNTDDPLIRRYLPSVKTKVLTLGRSPQNTLCIQKTSSEPKGFLALYVLNHQSYLLKTAKYAFPKIYAATFGTAILLASHFGISPSQAISAINTSYHPPKSRCSLLIGIHQSLIIDSSYNSSPQAATEFLNLLGTFTTTKIAVLGDMRELGLQSPAEHRRLAKTALKSADHIITVGPETKKHFPASPKAHSFLYWWQAADFLQNQPALLKKSTILVKGSQNTIFLEELVKKILRNPSDQNRLCRQSPTWITLKTKFQNSHRQT